MDEVIVKFENNFIKYIIMTILKKKHLTVDFIIYKLINYENLGLHILKSHILKKNILKDS